MNYRLALHATFAALTLAAQAFGQERARSVPVVCPPRVFLTFEQGKLAAVDWVDRTDRRVHTRVVAAQSQIVDATIDVRPDGTTSHSSVLLSIAGGEPEKPQARDLGDGAIYWSPRIPSSIEQAIARARVLGQSSLQP
jgi:hypothetical protein